MTSIAGTMCLVTFSLCLLILKYVPEHPTPAEFVIYLSGHRSSLWSTRGQACEGGSDVEWLWSA